MGRLQPTQTSAAGDQDRATPTSRQQGTHLGFTGGIVHHHQQPPVGQPGTVQAHSLLQLLGDHRTLHPESAEEPGEHVGGVERLVLGAPQVHIELPVGKPRPQPVSHPHRKRRLADPGLAGNRRDHDRGRLLSLKKLLDLGDGDLPAGEVVDVGRELAGPGWRRPRLVLVDARRR